MLFIHFLIGCVIGSFLCLVAERVPAGKSILFPASHCSYCQTPLKSFELIPILSILFVRFRCRYCQQKLSIVYFLSELLCGLLCLLVTFINIQPLYFLLFLFTAILLSLTDIFYLIVEPVIFYPSAILLSIIHMYLALPLDFLTSLILFVSLHLLNYVLPHSIGGGDIILLTFWGALLGGQSLILLLFVASSSGLIFIVLYRLLLHQKQTQLPFVPFLSLGLFIVFLYK
ncbi:prepilin peptidase [Candidatus Enterococcus mansonii]|uniref:Uncharacterized protein n=1 Tax=Candidatus Enterococcus mansonii TaxID=1834181 RepID=A0A242CBW2_9ENTE|nr:A24 family peptidase [Enterococcus sp. 4G2_DIV0659]OTO07743.1 hypothetical protein A5880_002013 [Enterococcus sp. 4G2_DIV0659]